VRLAIWFDELHTKTEVLPSLIINMFLDEQPG
jgi:hypothetical protein